MHIKHMFRLVIVIAICICIDLFITPLSSTAHATTIDLSDTANYNIRMDGSSAGSKLGSFYKDLTKDIDGNGRKDMMVCEYRNDYNGRTNSGSCYIIYDSILDSITSTGQLLDLADSTKWNIRFDGASAFDNLGYLGTSASDLDGNRNLDLILTAGFGEYTRSRSGSVYIIRDSVFRSITGTGNILDLNTTTNYTIRYDGATSPCELGQSTVDGIDLNDNGVDDLIMGGGHCGLQGRSRSGALYIIYDSLHSAITGTGNNIDLADTSTFNVVLYEAIGSYFTVLNSLVTKDIDKNGKLDLMVGLSNGDKNGRTDSGSVIVVYDSILDNYTGTGNFVDLTDTANFNIRYDGAAEFDYFGTGVIAADINGNGSDDFLLGAFDTDFNTRTDSGSLYVVYDSLITNKSGTGNVVDMSDTSKWHMRIDGATANEYLGGYMEDNMYDYDNNGKIDFVIPASGAAYNSRSESGSVYIMYDSIIDNYSGTGNILDMANSSLYSHRIDGAVAGDYFGSFTFQDDIDLDGTYDQIIAASWADPQSRENASSNYILYNFPHTIAQTTSSRSGSNISIVGTISASRSTTNINGFQYQIDSNTPGSGWSNCSATDGDFNAKSEGFTCTISNAPVNAGTHTVYMRAFNDLTVYTPQSRYATYSYTIGGGSGSASGPKKPRLHKNEGGVVAGTTDGSSSNQSPLVVVASNAVNFDNRLEVTTQEIAQRSFDSSLGKAWFVGATHTMWLKDYYNDANIVSSLQKKSSVISLAFDQSMLAITGKPGSFFSKSQLRLAFSPDGKVWKIIPSSVIDQKNNTVSAVDTIGGYYAIVAIVNTAKSGSTQGATFKKAEIKKTKQVARTIPKISPMNKNKVNGNQKHNSFNMLFEVVGKWFR